jgi:cyclopropane fatty-acyl-phospholipid synthase-like methyltransferase
MKFNSWNEYNKNTANNPPRKLCQEAVGLVEHKDFALDVGAGALNDTKYLLSLGFTVKAVDYNPSVHNLATDINSQRLSVEVSSLEDYNPPKNTFNYINAMFTLPFVKPEYFKEVFGRLYESLADNGIMAFQLFGDKDQWADTTGEDRFHVNMTFLDKDQVFDLLKGKNVIKNEEVLEETKLAVGGYRNSHEFRIILKK